LGPTHAVNHVMLADANPSYSRGVVFEAGERGVRV
jgi:hypothetical protein